MMHSSLKLATLALLLAACSDNNQNGNDGGTDAQPANTFKQTGQVIDFTSKAGVPGIIITGGGNTVTTDAQGNYTLPVPQNTPYSMTFASDPDAGTGYLTLHEQEWKLSGDANRGKTSAVSNATENLLKG